MTLDEALKLIEGASCYDDLFPPPDPVKAHRRLLRLVHTDRPDNASQDRVQAAFAKLNDIWNGTWKSGGAFAQGDIAALFMIDGSQVLKLPRDPADNDLMDREAENLAHLNSRLPEDHRPYFPELLGTERQRDAKGRIRRPSRIGYLDGFMNLEQLREAFPGGMDPRDVAWIWRRALYATGAAHQLDLIHGALLPSNIMISPELHGVQLVDWCYSAKPGQKIPALVEKYKSWYPREVLSGKEARPGTDIYLLTGCMIYLMGGKAHPALESFARGSRLHAMASRPHDAWQLLEEFDRIIERLYGPRKFRPLTVPAVRAGAR